MVKKLNISIEYVIDSKISPEILDELLKDEIHWLLRNKIDSLKDTMVHELNSQITKDHIYINIV